ncbi:MAG: MBL fold metallo-hydrolase, partial [Myxococcales bacterium]|nr:MBL fold metallo-hydrolase [Myxococcales bacterium]
MTVSLSFLGAADTVTGSRYLVEADGARILIDCGLFQGFKKLRLRNWADPPFDPASLDAVVLTHAHIDHSGYLPKLAQQGFRGPIYCSEGTLALCQILLPDAAYLQEEEANYANLRGHTKHHPALPLYTREDAERVLALFEPVTVGKDFDLGKGLQVRFRRAGHILGASMVRLWDASTSVLFTGDLGRPNDALMVAPDVPDPVDYLVCESTYGNRLHDAADPLDALDPIINRTAKRCGILIIPAFAVGRAQAL